VRRDHFPPGLQAALGFAFGRLERLLAHLLPALVVEERAHHVHAHLADFGSMFGSRHRV
jgi:hypothetical protein